MAPQMAPSPCGAAATRVPVSLVRMGATGRVGIALTALLGLWLALTWALH
jgi:hypothetical protein